MKKIGDILNKTQINTDKQADLHRLKRVDGFFEEGRVSGEFKKVTGMRESRFKLPKIDTKLLNKIHHWILLGLAFLMPVLFLPWGVEKAGLAKQLLLTILAGLGLIVWLCKALLQGKINYRKNWLNFGVFLLLAFLILNTVFSSNPRISFYQANANFANLWNFLFLAVFYFLLITAKNTLKNADPPSLKLRRASPNADRRRFDLIEIFLISVTLAVIYTFFQLLGVHILGGFTKTPAFNSVGTITSVAFLAGLAVIVGIGKLTNKGKIQGIQGIKGMIRKNEDTNGYNRYKLILTGAVLVNFVFILLVNFNVVWYCLIPALLFLLGRQMSFQPKRAGKEIILQMMILALSLTFMIFGHLNIRTLNQDWFPILKSPTEVSPNFASSIKIADQTLNKNNEITRTLFGNGLGTFGSQWLRYRPIEVNRSVFWSIGFIQGSSAFTTWLLETGYLGMLVILILMGGIVIQGIKGINGAQGAQGAKVKHGLAQMRKPFEFAQGKQINADTNFSDAGAGLFEGFVFLVIAWFLYPFNLTLYFALFFVAGGIVIQGTRLHQDYGGQVQGGVRRIDFRGSWAKLMIFSLVMILAMISVLFGVYFKIQHYLAEAYFDKGLYGEVGGLSVDLKDNERAMKIIDQRVGWLVKSYNFDKTNEKALRTIAPLYLEKLNLVLMDSSLGLDPVAVAQTAVSLSRLATEINPKEFLNWLSFALVYDALSSVSEGALDTALLAYDRALELDPYNPSLFFGRARSMVNESMRLSGEIARIKEGRSTNESQKKTSELKEKEIKILERAVQDLNKSLELKSDYAPAHFLLAQIYDAEGKIDEAILSISNTIVLNPSDAGLWFQLGLLHYRNEDWERARLALEESIRILNNYANARYFLGLVYDRQGKNEEALKQFEIVEKDNSGNEEVKKIIVNLKLGRSALEGIVPPGEEPAEREEPPL